MKELKPCRCLRIAKSTRHADNEMWYCENIKCYRKAKRDAFPKKARERPGLDRNEKEK